MKNINRETYLIKAKKYMPVVFSNGETDFRTSYVLYIKTLQISELHKDGNIYNLSEIWGLCFTQENRTVNKTT